MIVEVNDFVLAKISKDDIVFLADDGETRDLTDATHFNEPIEIDEFTPITIKNARDIIKRHISLDG